MTVILTILIEKRIISLTDGLNFKLGGVGTFEYLEPVEGTLVEFVTFVWSLSI